MRWRGALCVGRGGSSVNKRVLGHGFLGLHAHTYQFLGDAVVSQGGDREAEDGEPRPVAARELEDVLAVLAEGGPLLDVDVLSNAHSAHHGDRGRAQA